MLAFNDQRILEGAGAISRENMQKIVQDRYEDFDQNRRTSEARAADAADLKEIEQLEQDLKQLNKKDG